MKEVYKFGGTSIDHLDQCTRVILSRKENESYVIVSAFSGTTDYLLSFLKNAEEKKPFNAEDAEYLKHFQLQKIEDGLEDKDAVFYIQKKFIEFYDESMKRIKKSYDTIVNKKFNIRDHDIIIGFGEQIGAFILAEVITYRLKDKEGILGKYVDLGNIIDGNYKKVDKKFNDNLIANIKKEIIDKKKKNEVQILTGYIGYIPEGILHSISRGYTDYTGAIVASTLSADRYIIFKEVDGVCSTDPRIMKNKCLLLTELSYVEVLKMASGGMKAINTEAVKPAMKSSITMEVRNTFAPEKKGTLIMAKRKMDPNRTVQCITIKKDVCIIRFGGYDDELQKYELILMNLLEKYRFRKFFSTSDRAGTTVVVTNKPDKIDQFINELESYGTVQFRKNCAIVAIVSEEMRGKIGVLAKASNELSKAGASIHAVVQGASEIGIDFVIDEKYVDNVVENLHKAFF